MEDFCVFLAYQEFDGLVILIQIKPSTDYFCCRWNLLTLWFTFYSFLAEVCDLTWQFSFHETICLFEFPIKGFWVNFHYHVLLSVAPKHRSLREINLFCSKWSFETIQVVWLYKQSRTELTVVLAENSIIATSACRPSSRGHESCTGDCHGGVESWRPRGVSRWQRNWMTHGIWSGQARTECVVTTK